MGISVFKNNDLIDILIDKDIKTKKTKKRCKEVYEEQVKYAKQRAERGFCDRDLWDIGNWFLTLIPEMLKIYRKMHVSTPKFPGTNEETWGDEWNKILNKMIFLFIECREETCSMKNPYEEEYSKARTEFEDKYGEFGEKLRTPEIIAEEKRTGIKTWHFLHELPEYKDIWNKYSEEESKIREHREKCRLEAMELFTKWMKDLYEDIAP